MCCSLSSPSQVKIWVLLGMGHISVVVQFRSVACIKNQRLQNTVGKHWKGLVDDYGANTYYC